jgi:pimeloyl-ACP methyl ester carboxylesterase
LVLLFAAASALAQSLLPDDSVLVKGGIAVEREKPIMLKTMGSLFFGGEVKTLGNGVTFHGDHGYAQYYIPANSRNLPLVMWHGIGQSGKTFESTPDGREGFQAILTRRDWPVYIIDQPRRGRAGRTLAATGEAASPTALYESAAWDAFRFGLWIPPAGPVVFPNVQMPMDGYTIDQFFRQQTPDTGKEQDRKTLGETVGKLFTVTGPAILMTHSRSGQYGWATAMEQLDLVKGIVAYEPGHYVFPEGEIPADIPRGEIHVTAMDTPTVPLEEFKKLTRMPILIVYGDNIATEVSKVYNSEVWRSASFRGKQFVEAVNRHGGDARIVFLPDLGLKGNTHVPFADLNNIQVADHLESWLREKGLDKRDAPHQGPCREKMELTIPLQR